MCGRTACTLAPDEVSRACSYRNRGGQRRQPRWRDGDADKYRPSYNKSPQSMSPVLVSHRHFDKVTSALVKVDIRVAFALVLNVTRTFSNKLAHCFPQLNGTGSDNFWFPPLNDSEPVLFTSLYLSSRKKLNRLLFVIIYCLQIQ